jgi:ABC-2 type transport system permease protein
MHALARITRVEAKLLLRQPGNLFWALAFPALLLLVIGYFFPGGREPSSNLDGYRMVDLYAPISLAPALATVALVVLPTALASYRERGVLRRLSTTPLHPRRVVLAQLILQVTMALLSVVIALASAALVFDIPLPLNPFGFGIAALVAATSLLAIGLLIGALAPTMSSGQGIGLGLYFAMLYCAGIYFPRQAMSGAMRRISDFSPAGAAVQALQDTWSGRSLPVPSLLVMLAYAVLAGVIAVAAFRWE